MSAAVLFPYWQGGSVERDHAARIVLLHLDRFADSQRFVRLEARRVGEQNKSATLNALAALHPAVDVLVMVDADTIVPHAQIEQGIRWAKAEPGLVYCYRSYWRLTRAQTEALSDPAELPGDPECDWHALDPASTGCVAIARDCFDQVGGLDGRFGHWGYDDMAFAERCRARWPHRRVDGDAWHLWHGGRREDDSPLDAEPAQVAANWRLYREVYGS